MLFFVLFLWLDLTYKQKRHIICLFMASFFQSVWYSLLPFGLGHMVEFHSFLIMNEIFFIPVMIDNLVNYLFWLLHAPLQEMW